MVHFSDTPPPPASTVTFESIMSAMYSPPCFLRRSPTQIHTREQFVDYLTAQLTAVGPNEEYPLRTAIESAYESARRDIFLPPEASLDSGDLSPLLTMTVAGLFVPRAAVAVLPSRFIAVLTGLVAYGVDFGPVGGSQALASHANAMWCLHKVTESLLSEIVERLLRIHAKEEVDIDKVFWMLANTHAILALLFFFSEVGTQSAKHDAKIAGECVTASYKLEDFYSLFKISPMNSETHPVSTDVREQSSVSLVLCREIENVIGPMRSYGSECNAEEEAIKRAECFLSSVDEPHLRLLKMAAQFIRDFIPLHDSVLAYGSDPSAIMRVVNMVLGFPMPLRLSRVSLEEIKESFMECQKKFQAAETAKPTDFSQAFFSDSSPSQQHHEQEQRLQSMNEAPAPLSESNPMFIGLKNAGNTCFINSFTQLFFAARNFRIDLIREVLPRLTEISEATKKRETQPDQSTSPPPSGPKNGVIVVFVALLAQMHWRLKRGYHAQAVNTDFFRVFLPPPFNDGRQHDASEYAKVILELLDSNSASDTSAAGGNRNENDHDEERAGMGGTLHEQKPIMSPSLSLSPLEAQDTSRSTENTASRSRRPTVVARWFGGTIAYLLECLQCHCTHTLLSPFWDLSVPLRRESTSDVFTPLGAEAAVTSALEERFKLLAAHEKRCEDMVANSGACSVHSSGGILAITTYPSAENEECPAPPPLSSLRTGDSNAVSLQELVDRVLNYRTVQELLQGDNAPFCDSCRSRERALMRTAVHATRRESCDATGRQEESDESCDEDAIEGVPFYFTVQLNRFHYDRASEQYEKIMDAVHIEEELSIKVRVVSGRKCPASSRDDEEEQNEAEEELVSHCIVRYRLIAVVVHSGPSPRSGHYFTLLREPGPGNEWCLANDSIITKMSADTMNGVLSGSGGVFHILETPYILFYERSKNNASYVNETDGKSEEDDIIFPESLEKLFEAELQRTYCFTTQSGELHGSGGGKDGGGDNDDQSRKDDDDNADGFGSDCYRNAGGGSGPIY